MDKTYVEKMQTRDEKQILAAIWKVLQEERREESEKTYVVEATQYFETKEYDRDRRCVICRLTPDVRLVNCDTQKQALKKMKTYKKLGFDANLYYMSIKEIEDLMRQAI